ncbi:MAG: xanthine dehydrogenase family protein subunit M [Desulfurococcaceae archaeon]
MVAEHSIPPVDFTRRNTRIIPFDFEYYEPRTLDEALELLSRYREDAKVLAGGTDLLVKMKIRLIEPKILINIKKIPGLSYIVEEENVIRIGALTKLIDIEKSALVRKHLPALHDAVLAMGSVQVRNMATIGGNLCNASPAADTAPPLLVHEASVKLVSKRGLRVVSLEEFFEGPGRTVMEPDEVLIEVLAKKRGRGASAFRKISRVAVDISIASSAVYVVVENDVIKEARIALGSVAPRPLRAWKTENSIVGLSIGSRELREALTLLDEEISPITDVRSTAEYRRYIAKVLTWDALHTAYERLTKGW